MVLGGHAVLSALGQADVLKPFLTISYSLPLRTEDRGLQRYGKGPKDLCFLLFYIVVFSLIRQSAIRYLITPLAKQWGIKGQRKLDRFTEQGYAFLYWGTASAIGLVSLSRFIRCWQ